MSFRLARTALLAVAIATVVACGGKGITLRPPSAFTLSPLVSDGSTAAASTDANLRDPRGMAALTSGPMWVANNLDHTATVYEGTGVVQPLVVNVAVSGSTAGDVTGVVASNSDTNFEITNGAATAPARFVFATESGTLLGWSADVDAANAVTVYSDGSAAYTGLAIAGTGSGTQLYAADFRGGKIDIFDHAFARLSGADKFVDATLPAGYSPYNIQTLQVNGATVLAVAYAQRDAVSGLANTGAGLGAVNLYNNAGVLQTRLITPGGKLNAPWGLAVAPAAWGTLSGALLVGNNGDGRINGFDVANGAFLHVIVDSTGDAVEIEGLWGLAFGNGARNQTASALYLTAGGDGTTGLYARIDLGVAAPDIVAPTGVAITEPVAAANVSGTVAVAATATAAVRVVFSVVTGTDTREIGTDTTAPYTVNWNTGGVANGTATLTVTASDAAGNATTSAPIAVTVNNGVDNAAPTVTLTAPAAGNVTGVVNVSATAADNLGVGFVQFFAGTTLIGRDTTFPYSVQWNTAGLTGARTLTAVARDGAGNSTTSAGVIVNITGAVVTLAQLQTSVFTPLCANCHNSTGNGAGNFNLSSTSTTYDALVGKPSVNEPGQQLVQAGDSNNSHLIRTLEGTQTVGEQMPKDSAALSPIVIDQIRAWIDAGAAH